MIILVIKESPVQYTNIFTCSRQTTGSILFSPEKSRVLKPVLLTFLQNVMLFTRSNMPFMKTNWHHRRWTLLNKSKKQLYCGLCIKCVNIFAIVVNDSSTPSGDVYSTCFILSSVRSVSLAIILTAQTHKHILQTVIGIILLLYKHPQSEHLMYKMAIKHQHITYSNNTSAMCMTLGPLTRQSLNMRVNPS